MSVTELLLSVLALAVLLGAVVFVWRRRRLSRRRNRPNIEHGS